MKKIYLVALIVVGTFAFTSCSTDKCECTVNGVSSTITEDEAPDGVTLEEACDDTDALNKAQGTGSCKMI